MSRKRTDAERRVRQSDRLARVLRVLQMIQGPGHWNARAIAEKLDCSERTVYRDLQTLAAAGVPWYFDDYTQSYRIREGYRGHLLKLPPRIEPEPHPAPQASPDVGEDPRSIAMLAREAARRLLVEAEGVIRALDRLSEAIEGMSGSRPK